ncbi:MAG: Fic family protein [Burkholderiales bacterium]|nr:Fic family protein [Burkholderiales bacterium]
MKAQQIQQYEHPDQFEPLMPGDIVIGPLLELASDLTKAATALGSTTGHHVHGELRALLLSMNSYYTNRIEGEHTRPADIERALQQDFSNNADVARKQRLAVAHIDTEKRCEDYLDDASQAALEFREVAKKLAASSAGRPVAELEAAEIDPLKNLYSEEALKWLHESLFETLKPEDLTLIDGNQVVPGQLRDRQVAVGLHEAPAFDAVPRFIERWKERYSRQRRGEMGVVAALASHHRLAWIHPFLDGNGRVARLHTHLVLHAAKLTHGLWSPLRGFARTETKYKALLQAADEHRRGDLDGRGNLTEGGLVEWTTYALEMCIDQANFMTTMLNVNGMQGRMEAALTFEESALKTGVRREALRPLHYLFSTQSELARSEFKTMTGLGDRVATDLLSALLKQNYLRSDSAYGKVRFAIPRHALQFYFPDLWPEAQKDAAQEEETPLEKRALLFPNRRPKA